jgi:hypothetical protein
MRLRGSTTPRSSWVGRIAAARDAYRGGVSAGRLALALCVCLVAAGLTPVVAAGIPNTNPEKHFEILPGSFHFTPSSDQAAAHANWVTSFDFAKNSKGQTIDDVRSVIVNLPAGFNASNTAVPTCTASELLSAAAVDLNRLPSCPPGSTVGQISFDFGGERIAVPIYKMEVTSFGVTTQLGFIAFTSVQILTVSVRPGDDGLTVTAPDIENIGEPHDISVTIWGVPASHEHDLERQETCSNGRCLNVLGGPEPAGIPPQPFLSNPTGCETHLATMRADSWEHPEEWSEAQSETPPIAECERVPFDPSIEVLPSTRSAESPTGLAVSLVVPQSWETPFSIATGNLKDTTVALPEGITINPSAGSGLGACSPAEYGAETSSSLPGEGCPPESKIGSIEIETPLLAEKINGAVYVATPYDNPFNSLLALYIVARDPERGILIKVAGRIELNAVTGQLVTTFENTPQQPFSKFTLRFRPGATAPLVSPPACGSYAAQAALTSWSAPLEPRLVSSPAFEVTQGVREGPCPAGGVPPFHPQVISGTDNNDAGSYSPFYLRILREDGEQEITRFTTVLPPGLSGNLSGIPFCPEADIEAARVATGQQEIESPSCPAASEIGHTIVSAGVGTVLAQTPGRVYLAGPYHGSALSIVSITSAKVGPFDLGTVVIRFALHINPITAQVEVDANGSDPIPHIIDGIVVHVREVRVYMDREKFILNPTSCDRMSISETISGAGADPANPADQVPVTATAPFQAADCSSLAFKPGFKASTSAKTSKADGASLSVKLTIPGALGTQANIAKVKVELPKALPSRLTTLRQACLASVFEANPAGCPAASIVGQASALTPIVPVPLTGPAYFVSHGGEAFPSLIIVLQGYGITVDLVGSTFISKKGVTSSTFKTVPDVPVGTFELTLPEGPFSALAANVNVCKSRLVMPTEFVAQNGAVLDQTTKIQAMGCPKSKKATRKKASAHRKRPRTGARKGRRR